MDWSDLDELQYIAHIDNVPSILERGILSHNRSGPFRRQDIADADVQSRRRRIIVPGGRRLHDYANLYLCARNPMMYRRCSHHQDLCVLRVSLDVLQLPDVIVTDGNAASDYTRFLSVPEARRKVNLDTVFAEYWTRPEMDLIEVWENKRVKCAEVLVRDAVHPGYILGVRVSCEETRARLSTLAPRLDIIVDGHLFFR